MQFIAADASGFVPASHEDAGNPGVMKRVIAVASQFQAGHVQMLNWARLPAGSSFRQHYHEDMQEVFVLLKGCVSMQVGESSVLMRPGDTVVVSPREPHQMRNLGGEDAEYIVFGISSGQNGRTILLT